MKPYNNNSLITQPPMLLGYDNPQLYAARQKYPMINNNGSLRWLNDSSRSMQFAPKASDLDKISKAGISQSVDDYDFYSPDPYSAIGNLMSGIGSTVSGVSANDEMDDNGQLTTGQKFGNTIGSMGTMASTGAAIGGPWGALAGAAVGLGTGLADSLSPRKYKITNRDKIKGANTMSGNIGATALNKIDNPYEYAPTFEYGGTTPTDEVFVSKGEIVKLPDGTIKKINGKGTKNSDSNLISAPIGTKVVSADTSYSEQNKLAKKALKIANKASKSTGLIGDTTKELNMINASKLFDEAFNKQEEMKLSKINNSNKFARGGKIGGRIINAASSLSSLMPAISNIAQANKDLNYMSPQDYMNPYSQSIINSMRNKSYDTTKDLNSIQDSYSNALYSINQSGLNPSANMAAKVALASNLNKAKSDTYSKAYEYDTQRNASIADYLNKLGQDTVSSKLQSKEYNDKLDASRRSYMDAGISDISKFSQLKASEYNRLMKDKAMMNVLMRSNIGLDSRAFNELIGLFN